MRKNIIAVVFVVFIGVLGIIFYAFSVKRTSLNKLALQTNVNAPLTAKNEYGAKHPTIDSVFMEDHSWIATLSAQRVRTLIATGDVIPARVVNFKVVQKNNSLWPYEKVKSFFDSQKKDIVFINLETPLTPNCEPTMEGMNFCSDERNIKGLTSIGVTVASLANNHAGNKGLEGIQNTTSLLAINTILVTGTKDPVYKDIRGIRFAFLGYNDIGHKEQGISWASEDRIRNDIKEARQKADIVVVAFHWGIEYQSQPDQRQIHLGHVSIDAGADLVIGNHPHWIQAIEFYKDKLIAYAHGNFVFDQMWSQKTREGVVGKYAFYDNQLVDVEYFPLQIQDFGQPYFLEGERKKQIFTEMLYESQILAGKKDH